MVCSRQSAMPLFHFAYIQFNKLISLPCLTHALASTLVLAVKSVKRPASTMDVDCTADAGAPIGGKRPEPETSRPSDGSCEEAPSSLKKTKQTGLILNNATLKKLKVGRYSQQGAVGQTCRRS
jgi:hypothetical protein